TRGGVISTDDDTEICASDSASTNLTFEVVEELGDRFRWLVVDEDGTIVYLDADPTIDFSELEGGNYKVYHISYFLPITGLRVDRPLANISGCFDLSNSITVNNFQIAGGELLDSNNNSSVSVCAGDGEPDNIDVQLVDASGDELIYIITDEDSTILMTADAPPFDFENAGPGTCLLFAVSYGGQLIGAEMDNELSDLEGCFELSTALVVNRESFDGGSIETQDGGEVVVMTCSGDGQPDIVEVLVTGEVGTLFSFLVTDTLGNILEVSNSNFFDFEGVEEGVCLIWHIAYGDTSLLDGVTVVDSLDGCFDLSNPISIIRTGVAGGEISINGATSLTICPSDTGLDSIQVDIMNASGDTMTWVLTDTLGNILELSDSDIMDYSDLEIGTYLLWNISYSFGLLNLEVGNNVDTLEGCFDFSNSINISRFDIEGGSISLEGGATSIDICSGDGVADTLDVMATGFSGPNMIYLITDTSGMVLAQSESNLIDLEGAPQGTCLIYHLMYTDSITIQGDSLNVNALQGCHDLSNAISVNRNEVNGGMIMTTDSMTVVNVIVGDSIPDLVDVIIDGAIGDSMQWVITDTLGVILSLPDTFPVDFEDVPVGVCLIWNVSYLDSIAGLEVGENAADLMGCFDLSNPITVIRSLLIGGSIMTPDSLVSLEICAGDGIADSIQVVLEGNEGTNSAWVITDTSGLILDLPVSPPFDFEGAGGGICLIWHLSFETGLMGLDVGENVNNLSGAFSFSNSIAIIRNGVNGGMIMTTDSLTLITVCSGDGIADSVDIILTGIEGDSLQWVITDDSLNILDLPAGPPFDFENAGAGTCLIWHLAYNDSIAGLEVGLNAGDIDGCFDLSNAITLEREEVDGGMLTTDTGLDTIEIIAGDGMSDAFDVILTDTIGLFSSWIITNPSNQIIGLPPGPPFDLENAGGGVCQIWHLSSNEMQNLQFGMTLDDIVGCSDLSNPITVIRAGLNGGIIQTPDGLTDVDICILEGMVDSIDVMLMDTSGTLFSWIITDTLGTILGLPANSPFDFSGAGNGVCQIWHIAYEPGLMGLEIDSSVNNLQGSFDLSNNINVNRSEADGGMIMTSDSLTEVSFMVADGMDDIVTVLLSGEAGDTSLYVITDSSGIILDTSSTNVFNFEGVGPGVCLIWHLSYSGTINGLTIGGDASQLTGCLDLSNPITVNRSALNGGILTTTDFLTSVEICIGNNIDEPFSTILSDTIGSNFQWIVTDTSGLIVGLPSGPPFVFDGAGPGICQLWHMAFESGLTGDTLDGNISGLMGDFDFSNPITITRNEVAGGAIETASGQTEVTIFVNEGITDTIEVNLMGAIGDSTAWVITDTIGNILDLPSAPPFFFENAGEGVCLIWNLSYQTGLTGLMTGNNVSVLDGCFSLSNPVTVTREEINGGILTDLAGNSAATICANDTIADPIDVILTDTMGIESDWVIVDLAGVILDIPSGPPFEPDSINVLEFEIYHISSTGNLMGLTEGANIANLSGGFNLSNALSITKSEAVGGMIETIDGLTEVTIEVGEGVDDTIQVVLVGQMGDSSQYVITDTLGNIIDLPMGPSFLFEDAGAGTCMIWHLSYSGNLTGLAAGENVADLTGCFDFSNSITVIKEGVNGGNLTDSNGATTVVACIGDGVNDGIDVILTDTVGMNYNWVLTTESGLIIGIPIGPPFNFENAPIIGNILIWHLAYDSITPPVDNGLIGQNISVFSGNFDFSNPITIIKEEVDGGTISTNDNTNIIVGDGIIDTVEVGLINAEGDTMSYVVTDTLGDIMAVQSSTIFTFENAGPGVCQIWNVSYSFGLTGLQVGNNIDALNGCFALSNPINIMRSTTESIVVTGGNTFDYVMYPIPATDRLEIEFRKMPEASGDILIFNRMGQLIQSHTYNQRVKLIDIENLDAGLYYIKINSGPATTSDKLIIVK
ncbi:MAG: T9SS type A sorting domain-containing protein, partial [Saprospiraceae bacterium]|nr:T9SS type A sorting domain-containing protein [Saprospiraceae bacterium]